MVAVRNDRKLVFKRKQICFDNAASPLMPRISTVSEKFVEVCCLEGMSHSARPPRSQQISLKKEASLPNNEGLKAGSNIKKRESLRDISRGLEVEPEYSQREAEKDLVAAKVPAKLSKQNAKGSSFTTRLIGTLLKKKNKHVTADFKSEKESVKPVRRADLVSPSEKKVKQSDHKEKVKKLDTQVRDDLSEIKLQNQSKRIKPLNSQIEKQEIKPQPQAVAAGGHKSSRDSLPQIMMVHTHRQLAREISAQLLLELPGSSVVFAPTVDFAVKLTRRCRFDLIIVGADLLGENSSDLKTALNKLSEPPTVMTLGRNQTATSAAIQSVGYTAARALKFKQTKINVADTLSRRGLAMPLQHLRTRQNNERTPGKLLAKLKVTVGVANQDQKISKTVETALGALGACVTAS